VPDITAARPAAGAPIESSWGGQVHDSLEGLQTGQVSSTGPATAGASYDVNVVFPRPYASVPRVVATIAWNTTFYLAIVFGTSTTGFTLRFTRKDNATFTNVAHLADWIAVGTPA